MLTGHAHCIFSCLRDKALVAEALAKWCAVNMYSYASEVANEKVLQNMMSIR